MAIVLYAGSPAPLGESTYRMDDIVVPTQFKPTLVASATKNAQGSNVNVRVKATYPIAVKDTAGVWAAKNQIVCTVNFTALQNVLADVEKTRLIDEVISYLTANKAKIISGSIKP